MNKRAELEDKTRKQADLHVMSPAPQSGGVGCRHAGFGGTERRSGDGSDPRLLPLLPQGLKNLKEWILCVRKIMSDV